MHETLTLRISPERAQTGETIRIRVGSSSALPRRMEYPYHFTYGFGASPTRVSWDEVNDVTIKDGIAEVPLDDIVRIQDERVRTADDDPYTIYVFGRERYDRLYAPDNLLDWYFFQVEENDSWVLMSETMDGWDPDHVVLRFGDDPDELRELTIPPNSTAVQATTWGRLKQPVR